MCTYEIQGLNSSDKEGAIKATQYLQNIKAKSYADKAGFDDALFISEEEVLLELTTANVFFVIDGKLVTPPLSTGILPGVTRLKIMEGLESQGVSIEEEVVRLKDLKQVEAAFACSSVKGWFP